jgi:hypothetical protein
MKNKKLIYIVGGLAIAGIVYYMYKKRQEQGGGGDMPPSGSGGQPPRGAGSGQPPSGSGSGQPPSGSGEAPATEPTTDSREGLSKKEVRKAEKSDSETFMAICGKRPSLKKNRPAWQKCIDEQKAKASSSASPFEGASTYFDIHSSMTGEITENMDIF